MNRKFYLALTQRRADLFQKAQDLLGADNPTAEQIAEANDILKVQLPPIDEQLATFEALFERERTAPAVATVTVTDRAEQDPMRGFHSAADFAIAVRNACIHGGTVDARLLAMRNLGGPQAAPASPYHQEGHSGEGYMVPPQVTQEIWKLIFEMDDLFQLCRPEPTSSNQVQLLADETTPWGATGIQAKWRAEASQMTPSRLGTQDRATKLHELYAFILASEELLEDAPLLGSRVTSGAAAAISWKASEAVVRGTGAGQPLGYENAPCLVTVAKESGQAADTLVPKNLTKMYSRLYAGPGALVRWVANRDIVPQLVDLKIGNDPSWVGINQGLREAPRGLILGEPVIFSEHAKTLGDLGDIALVNFAGYHAAQKRGGVKFDTSIHLYFDYAMTAFRWMFRIGGQPYLSAPVSPANGSNTRSHFVVLAERA